MNFLTSICFFPLFLSSVSVVLASEKLFSHVVCDNVNAFFARPKELFETHPKYIEVARSFNSKEKIRIEQKNSLFVDEFEVAATLPSDNSVTILASDAGSSGIIAILRHTGSQATGMTVFTGSKTSEGAELLFNKVKSLTTKTDGTYELYLIGGTAEEISQKAFNPILYAFYKLEFPFALVMANVDNLNTEVKGAVSWPINHGAGVNVKTGEIFPVISFEYKGPESPLRVSRAFTGINEFIDIYDSSNERFILYPKDFQYEPLSEPYHTDFKKPDEELIKIMSNCPLIEPEDFIPRIRAAYKFVEDNPDPKIVFMNDKPIIYKQKQGVWTKIED